ncbi:type II toxin-antitoxin system VapC family toxin [Mesorhizobium sp.]|uniref:type II toxin-antitoxin system VapC family toxin n=1 Tax=Mesorhizobium sp. TaxID=1871066 RepID=UPI000FE782BE|nr:type II toxin-antitoxin system VapC family toxin [Mesorhizobium sp.]RWP75452.1 MAG: type II toxin-antitoxin system VapC family toxin [Mesorhizobium sp.]
MSALVVDTSALISILGRESDNVLFANAIARSELPSISSGMLYEAYCVALRGRYPEGAARLEVIVSELQLEILAFDLVQLSAARLAYSTYGRGTGHPANLNMGDCFAYALAKTRDLPLLFKGDDFIHTDIEPAVKPA